MVHYLDEPFALQKSQLTQALALLWDLAYWRTSPLSRDERAVCARMVYRLSRLLTELEVRPDMLTIRRGEEDQRGETHGSLP
jgi:hypothetical protein